MAESQALRMVESWQQWDGRIVNGKFPLRRYLGGSQWSAVYLTEIHGTPAAVKLIPTDAPHARTQIAHWKLAAQLSHPNLIRILQVGSWHADDEQDMMFAIMEYCEESLAGVLCQRPLTPTETREMLVPALDALSYLHAQHILHGKIKPTNILAVGDQLKLTSDGVHRTDEADYSETTGPYEAPEEAKGKISLSGDVWSLGVTLVEALTSSFPGPDVGDPGLPDKLPPPFDAIAKGCLTLDPERRLSITAIRNLLDMPSVENEAEKRQLVAPETKAVATIEAASSQDQRTATAYGSAAARPSWRDESAEAPALAGKRRVALIATAVFLILAIAAGLRLVRYTSKTQQPAAARMERPEGATGAPAARGGPKSTTVTTRPGAVLHEVMPEVSGQARNTITGTVKVKVRVVVDAEGKVSQAKLEASGPSKYFSNQGLEAARQWTFIAPMRDGKPEASTWTLLFEFRKDSTKATARRAP